MLVDVDRNSIQTEKPSKRPLWKRGTAGSKPIPTAFSKLSIFLPVPFFAKIIIGSTCWKIEDAYRNWFMYNIN